jgi:hypothetical protein
LVDRLHDRIEVQAIACGHQMDRGAHQGGANGSPAGDQAGKSLGAEGVQPGPESDIRIIGLLCLHPDEVFNSLGDRQRTAAQQQLPLE